MKLFYSAAIAALGLVLIAGCSPKGGAANNTAAATPSGSPAASGAAPASGQDVTIAATDLPRPKAGLWETVTTTEGQAPTTSRRCEKGEAIKAPVNKDCAKFEFKRTALGGIEMNIACGPHSDVTVHAVITGDFDSHYVSDTEGTATIPGHPPMVIKTHSEGRYIGPCPAGGGDS
jgi:hypothetical protein